MNIEIQYFQNYHDNLEIFLTQNSIGLTTGKYYKIVNELESIKTYIKTINEK